MSATTRSRWEKMRTNESREVERILRREFSKTDAYRYNSASIRVRIVDPRFEGKSTEERDALVEPLLKKLPKDIQSDIMNLVTLYPEEPKESLKARLFNDEFEEPSPSSL